MWRSGEMLLSFLLSALLIVLQDARMHAPVTFPFLYPEGSYEGCSMDRTLLPSQESLTSRLEII